VKLVNIIIKIFIYLLFYLCMYLFIYKLMLFICHRYSEDANNCFDFVLQFLQFYLHSVCSENQDELLMWDSVTDREKFCSSWIVPQTRKAARYISLYRRLLVEAVIVDSTGQQLVNVESYTTHL